MIIAWWRTAPPRKKWTKLLTFLQHWHKKDKSKPQKCVFWAVLRGHCQHAVQEVVVALQGGQKSWLHRHLKLNDSDLAGSKSEDVLPAYQTPRQRDICLLCISFILRSFLHLLQWSSWHLLLCFNPSPCVHLAGGHQCFSGALPMSSHDQESYPPPIGLLLASFLWDQNARSWCQTLRSKVWSHPSLSSKRWRQSPFHLTAWGGRVSIMTACLQET